MAGFATSNLTSSPSCNLNTNNLFKDLQQACSPYINTLQTCPKSSVTPANRLRVANQTSHCIDAFLGESLYPSYALNYTKEDPVTIEADPNCHYIEFLPILQNTCSYDFSRLNDSCSSTSNTTGLTPPSAWTLCQTEAAIQYVRCTLQKPSSKVASCVTDNAVKVDWLPQIQTYTGASSCQNVNIYLISQGIHLFRHIFGALFGILVWPRVMEVVKRRFRSITRRRQDKKDAAELQNFHKLPKGGSWHRGDAVATSRLEFDPWILEKRYTLKATYLLQSIGREVLVAYITILMLAQSGVFADSSFNEEISFYVVRPRPAPFIGLLGIFEPWSQKGLAELIVDGMLSFVAGTNVAAKYWGLVNHAPNNPVAPASDLRTLAVGAVMMCVPAFAVLVITFLVSMGMASNSDKKGKRRKDNDDGCGEFIAGLCVWTLWLLAIAAFICILPLVAIVEMIAAAVVTIRQKLKKRKAKAAGNGDDPESESDLDSWSNVVGRSRWEEPLTTTSGKFRILYALFILSSFIINIGNWLFFASYLKLEGELYCPTASSSIIAVWILVPLGIDLVFYAFRAWTNDTYFDTHPVNPVA